MAAQSRDDDIMSVDYYYPKDHFACDPCYIKIKSTFENSRKEYFITDEKDNLIWNIIFSPQIEYILAGELHMDECFIDKVDIYGDRIISIQENVIYNINDHNFAESVSIYQHPNGNIKNLSEEQLKHLNPNICLYDIEKYYQLSVQSKIVMLFECYCYAENHPGVLFLETAHDTDENLIEIFMFYPPSPQMENKASKGEDLFSNYLHKIGERNENVDGDDNYDIRCHDYLYRFHLRRFFEPCVQQKMKIFIKGNNGIMGYVCFRVTTDDDLNKVYVFYWTGMTTKYISYHKNKLYDEMKLYIKSPLTDFSEVHKSGRQIVGAQRGSDEN